MGRHRTAIVPIRPQTETQEPKKAEQNQPKLKAGQNSHAESSFQVRF